LYRFAKAGISMYFLWVLQLVYFVDGNDFNMITWMVENSNKEVIAYTDRLSDAKRIAQCEAVAKITKIVGPYPYEGYHAYYVVWDGKTFKTEKRIK
jgi:hypothetical protein